MEDKKKMKESLLTRPPFFLIMLQQMTTKNYYQTDIQTDRLPAVGGKIRFVARTSKEDSVYVQFLLFFFMSLPITGQMSSFAPTAKVSQVKSVR